MIPVASRSLIINVVWIRREKSAQTDADLTWFHFDSSSPHRVHGMEKQLSYRSPLDGDQRDVGRPITWPARYISLDVIALRLFLVRRTPGRFLKFLHYRQFGFPTVCFVLLFVSTTRRSRRIEEMSAQSGTTPVGPITRRTITLRGHRLGLLRNRWRTINFLQDYPVLDKCFRCTYDYAMFITYYSLVK